MLSIIDLLEDDTLDLEMSSFLLFSMLKNASFITAANPMGAGKTTLMGCLLNLLKPGIKIRSVEPNQLPSNGESDIRYLGHELKTQSRPYYGYIHGNDVKKFISLISDSSIAGCMHADTVSEMKSMLFSQNVKKEDFTNVDLLLFMRMEGGFSDRKRRVSHIYESTCRGHELLFKWKKDTDTFKKVKKSNLVQKVSD